MPAHGVQLENIPSAAPTNEFKSFHMGEKFAGNAITSRYRYRSVGCESLVVIETTNIFPKSVTLEPQLNKYSKNLYSQYAKTKFLFIEG